MEVLNKKKAKLLLGILTILFLLIQTCVPVFATITEDTNTSTITVSGLEAGVTAYLYQLTTVNYNYDADQPEDPQYVWVDELQDWISSNFSSYINSDGSVSEDFNEDDISSSDATDFYSKLISAIKGGEISLTATASQTASGTATYPVTEENANNEVEFTGLSMGTYLVLVENGYRVYTPVVVNLTPTYDEDTETWSLEAVEAEADIKSTTPTITKTVTDTESTVDNYSTTDDISYTIIADIPNYETDSLSTTYTIEDNLGDGLSLTTDSVKVYGVTGSSEIELSSSAYTINATSSKLTLEFDYDEISSYEQIKVTYTATLSNYSSLVVSSDGNINQATLTYSNNPYVASSSTTQDSDEVTVYTYGIEVLKVDKSDTSVVLEGAEFELTNGSNTLYFVLEDGIYYLAESTDTGATSTLVTDENGLITVYGLDEGTYYLTETKAPSDYTISTNTVTIEIVDEDLDGIIDTDTDAVYNITFPNSSSFSLPLTGGTGTIIFVVAGIVFIGVGVILISKKKKAKKN